MNLIYGGLLSTIGALFLTFNNSEIDGFCQGEEDYMVCVESYRNIPAVNEEENNNINSPIEIKVIPYKG